MSGADEAERSEAEEAMRRAAKGLYTRCAEGNFRLKDSSAQLLPFLYLARGGCAAAQRRAARS